MIIIAGTSKDIFEYDNAWLYCACLYLNGYSDWRLPTKPEYYTLNNANQIQWCWFENRVQFVQGRLLNVAPVRDI